MSRRTISLVSATIAVTLLASQAGAQTLSGTVRDETDAVLPGATVMLRDGAGAVVQWVAANAVGRYTISAPQAGQYTIEVSLPNFATRRITGLVLAEGETRELAVVLPLRLSADVVVSAKRSFRQMAEFPESGGSLLGVADSASEGLVTSRQLDSRAVMRPGEVLEAIPGLIISQHSGEGKANQFYLRGFNLDHGTDFATSVAGVPVNLPTHAHGQGYSDVNFLIPELVSAVQYQKGLYSAQQGDFTTAGASHVRYVTELSRPLVQVSSGAYGWQRVLAAASPRVAGGHLLVALERGHNDGPWRRPDDYQKWNGVVGFSRGDRQNSFGVTAQMYDGTWNGTDQAPARAVDTGALDRFDGIDPTSGGRTARHSVSADWQRTRAATATRATAYAMRYRLNLFSNFTYFLDDPVNGDQFEQSDRRWVYGGRLSHRMDHRLAGRPASLVIGGDLRRDDISEVGLHRTRQRERLSTVRQDEVVQSSVGSYVEHEVQWTTWARTNAGMRVDGYWFDVAADNPLNTGTSRAAIVSPKGSLIVGPFRNTEFYASAGSGFHSNDARGTTMRVDPASGEAAERVTPLARARGMEVGVRTVPRPGVQATLALWTLSLDSELVFVGDAGTTDAGRPSRRSGLEVSAFYQPRPWVTLDVDTSWSRARFRDGAAAGSRIPGALERVASGGLTIAPRGRVSGSVRLRHFGPRDLVEDGSVRSSSTTVLNGHLAFTLAARARVVLDAFNLSNSRVNDIDYFYTSRLPGEPLGGVDDVHSHPAIPRSARVSLQIGF